MYNNKLHKLVLYHLEERLRSDYESNDHSEFI